MAEVARFKRYFIADPQILVFLFGIHNTGIMRLPDSVDNSRHFGEWSFISIVPEADTVSGNTVNVPRFRNASDQESGTANCTNRI